MSRLGVWSSFMFSTKQFILLHVRNAEKQHAFQSAHKDLSIRLWEIHEKKKSRRIIMIISNSNGLQFGNEEWEALMEQQFWNPPFHIVHHHHLSNACGIQSNCSTGWKVYRKTNIFSLRYSKYVPIERWYDSNRTIELYWIIIELLNYYLSMSFVLHDAQWAELDTNRIMCGVWVNDRAYANPIFIKFLSIHWSLSLKSHEYCHAIELWS